MYRDRLTLKFLKKSIFERFFVQKLIFSTFFLSSKNFFLEQKKKIYDFKKKFYSSKKSDEKNFNRDEKIIFLIKKKRFFVLFFDKKKETDSYHWPARLIRFFDEKSSAENYFTKNNASPEYQKILLTSSSSFLIYHLVHSCWRGTIKKIFAKHKNHNGRKRKFSKKSSKFPKNHDF